MGRAKKKRLNAMRQKQIQRVARYAVEIRRWQAWEAGVAAYAFEVTRAVLCKHPDPKTLQSLFCRTCGYWENGVRVGEATNEGLRGLLERAKASDAAVTLHTPDCPAHAEALKRVN